ncbi:MAG: hypothetical protein Q7O66_06830 [Dehalococcoidia bacterium]|nr:hypothetical protein [Dehalococcoidia bacterium]
MPVCPYCLVFQTERDLALDDLQLMFEVVERYRMHLQQAAIDSPNVPVGFMAMLQRRKPKPQLRMR